MVGEPIIDIEGLVYIDDWDENPSPPDHITLDALVARAAAPKMLEDEPQSAQLLLRLRRSLITALEHVNTALKSLSET